MILEGIRLKPVYSNKHVGCLWTQKDRRNRFNKVQGTNLTSSTCFNLKISLVNLYYASNQPSNIHQTKIMLDFIQEVDFTLDKEICQTAQVDF